MMEIDKNKMYRLIRKRPNPSFPNRDNEDIILKDIEYEDIRIRNDYIWGKVIFSNRPELLGKRIGRITHFYTITEI